MKNRIFLWLSVISFFVAPAFGALPSKQKTSAQYGMLGTPDTRLSLAGRYSTGNDIVQPPPFSNSGFTNHTGSYTRSNSSIRNWCLVHKMGLIFIASGGGLMLTGVIVFATAPKDTGGDGFFFISPQQGAGIGLFVFGFAAILLGLPLLIGGAIHDHKKSRYSLVAPKNNEIGVAFNLHH